MTYPAITELLAHRPPMLLLDAVVSKTTNTVHCRTTLGESCIFYVDGTIPAVVAMELMAQCIGAFVALQRLELGLGRRLGFLVAARDLELYAESLPLGQSLDVTVQLLFADGGSGQFDCRVSVADSALAAAKLTVVEAPTQTMSSQEVTPVIGEFA